MPEKLIAEVFSKVIEYKDAFVAIIAAVIGGGIAYLQEVRLGNQEWAWSAFFLALASSGFIGWVTYFLGIELLGWSNTLSAVVGAMVGHIGADKVKAKLSQAILNRIE